MSDQLSLSRAALRLNLTYHQVRSLVLRGDLEGGQDESGRFFVATADLDRYLDDRPRPDKSQPKRRRASGGR
jgi:hypothetical protein